MRDLSSCVIEKFNGFNIIRVEISKSIRQTFRPIDTIYNPVRKPDEIINSYSSERLNVAFRASFSEGTKVKHCQEMTNLTATSKIIQDNQVMIIILIHKIY